LGHRVEQLHPACSERLPERRYVETGFGERDAGENRLVNGKCLDRAKVPRPLDRDRVARGR